MSRSRQFTRFQIASVAQCRFAAGPAVAAKRRASHSNQTGKAQTWQPARSLIGLLSGLVGMLLTVAMMPTHGEFLAYSVTEADRSPLPRNLENINAKHLVNIAWGPYAGPKARVGVLKVDNTSGLATITVDSGDRQSEISLSGQQVPVNGIEAIVTDTMARTGRFSLVERKILNEVLGEQDLGERVSQPSAARVGKVLGAEYLLQVVVTDYEDKTSSIGGGAIGALTRVPVLGGIGIKSSEGRIGLNFRLIDAETSEVVYTRQLESVIRESGLLVGAGGVGGGIGLAGFLGKYSKTPIGQAVIAGVNKGVFDLVLVIGAKPAQGSVVKVEKGQIWLNRGQDAMVVGDALEVFSRGEELIDPETGISLGSEHSMTGRARVTEVREKFSIAQLDASAGTVNRGDRVISLAAPPSIEFADAWVPPQRPKRLKR